MKILCLLFLVLTLTGCATLEDGPDTTQKYDSAKGYNFGTGCLPQPPIP